ncbi:MarR family winged helix-turn-helix transcriptional regulator [Lentibacillus jeotgali]|uniref:MarR family winged helix-turn-helix transcriptional regulator n=1 Tax=Lentibacillus jeotgali TaxID=558169 RepID=UPI0002628C24|nr:MarR family transcriptional regulator [Lentibacillus jeotgali]
MSDNILELIRAVELFTNKSIIRFNEAYEHNIGISSILVLAELNKKGPQKSSAIAKELSYTPGAMTNIANKLINEGYAVRQYDEKDRRRVMLAITDQGQHALEDAQKTGQVLRKDVFETLTEEEIRQFRAIYEKLLDQLDT